ncbi:MAG TPA: hypothetical protein PK957_01585 [Candidatus Dojkabacteria bacterium]|nr:hypothetical protein [Candidatus Dojkabacteria bacterium]HQF36825.1 hypothetical protein [Candidatus Dojkabacteria bacterium]
MNRLGEIILTVSIFFMVPILLVVLVVPTLIVSNLSPTVRTDDYAVVRKNKTVLGTQSSLVKDVEVRFNDELLKTSPAYRINTDNIRISFIHLAEQKHTVLNDSIFLKNRSDENKTVYFIPRFDQIPSDVEIALTVGNISNVIIDSNGNYWPQEIHLVPGEELLLGFRIDGRYEIHSDIEIDIEISVE